MHPSSYFTDSKAGGGGNVSFINASCPEMIFFVTVSTFISASLYMQTREYPPNMPLYVISFSSNVLP